MMAKKTKTRKTTTSDNHPTTQYAIDVCEGRIIAGPIVRDACRRHLNDLENGHERGLTFSVERADHALGFFPRILRLNGGEFEGKPFALEPAQRFIVGSIFGWINDDGTRRFRLCYIEIGKGAGKSPLVAGIGLYGLIADGEARSEVYAAAPLALDTLVPTPTGWTTQGALKVGDEVFDENGLPCEVTYLSPILLGKPCFDVEFDDGTVVVADADHRWLTTDTRGQTPKHYQPTVVTTAQIAATLRAPTGRLRHRIAVAGEIQTSDVDVALPIDPYTLGVWLGDGRNNRGAVCYHYEDTEPTDRIRDAGYDVTNMRGKNNTCYATVRGLRTQLRKNNLLDNKHVPAVYLRASRAQRLALLQGLMDTDGTCTMTGECRFTNREQALALSVHELATGLGIRASMGEQTVMERPHYTVSFKAPKSIRVFHMKRKFERQVSEVNERAKGRYIRSVTPRESVPVRCIEVSSESHLYLVTRSHIATHNTKRDQAMILFRDAVAMVDQSPKLSAVLSRSGRGDKVWNLYHTKSSSFFRPISADDGQSGPRPHFGLIDELHEHKSPVVINMMAAGRKGRRQPLIVSITNSGHDVTSVCWEYHQMAIDVCSGKKRDDTFFAYVCALDEGDDPFNDESCWIKANPLLGVTIQPKYLRDEVTQARGLPSKESMVLRLNFCQWTEANNPLIPMGEWEKNGADYTLEYFRGAKVYLGLDLSRTTDLTAAVFVMKKDGKFWWWPEFWLPKDGLRQKIDKDKVPYDACERQGHLRTTPGRAIDKDLVAKHILELQSKYSLKIVDAPYDKAFIEEFRASCDRVGLSLPLSEFQQGFISMAPAVNALETGILNSQIRHNKNPILRMCAAHAVVSEDAAGNRKFNKDKSTGRIDGIVAGSMALVRAMQSAEPTELRIRWA